MYGIAYSILRNREDAEDAVHNAFVRIADNYSKISNLSCNEIESYIVIIIRNSAIDIYRKNKRDNTSQELTENTSDRDNLSDMIITKELLKAAVKQLPDKYKDVLFLCVYEQHSAKETGKILGISESDVRVRLHRAKTVLKKLMKEDV